MLTHSSSKITLCLAVSALLSVTLLATSAGARAASSRFIAIRILTPRLAHFKTTSDDAPHKVREQDARAIKQHVDFESRVLVKRQAASDELGDDPANTMIGHTRRPHHSKSSKSHTTTTKLPDVSPVSSDAQQDDKLSATSTKTPDGSPNEPKHHKHKSTTRKPKHKSSATTTFEPKSETTTAHKQRSTKKPSKKSKNKTSTTPGPDDDSSSSSVKKSKASDDSSNGEKAEADHKSKSKHVSAAKDKAKKESVTPIIDPVYEGILKNQEYIALEHMLAGADNWLKVLRLSKGRVFNPRPAGELFKKLTFELANALREEDKPYKLMHDLLKHIGE